MLKRTLCSLLFVSAVLTLPVAGQTKESLLIGPGDLLHVLVFDNPELEQHVRVTDAGNITLIMGGAVSVSNKTPAEAGKAIQDALLQGHVLLKPQVSVTVEQYETQSVTVIGEVKDPSFYRINTPTSIIEILAMAGGVSDTADRRILIERRGTQEKVPYFLSNDATVAAQTAVLVNPGDIVIVPKAGIVYILGDVGRPGGYAITDNESKLSVLGLVARAGGTNHSAVPSQAKLIHKTDHGYETTPLPLSDIQKGKRPDLQLQANDVIYVPFSYLRNIAMQGAGIAGSVATASIYRF
jgi:polysaccharide export outer membrane protein